MKIKQYLLSLVTIIVMLGSLSSPAIAQQKTTLADIWVITPIQGQEAQFEAAFNEHLKYRKSKGDTRTWKTYEPTVGSDISGYVVRFCCIEWKDMDSYQKWNAEQKLSQHWNKHVHQYVAHYEHYLSELDSENSNWLDDNNFQYFGVTHYKTKMGSNAGVAQSKKALSDHAKAMKWPYNWAWSSRIGGRGNLTLVVGYDDYAAMTPPDKSFAEALAAHMKSPQDAGELLQAWSSNFHSTTYTIYRIREDMSMKD